VLQQLNSALCRVGFSVAFGAATLHLVHVMRLVCILDNDFHVTIHPRLVQHMYKTSALVRLHALISLGYHSIQKP
jgi:hypothetical protein